MKRKINNYVYECPNTGVGMLYDIANKETIIIFRKMRFTVSGPQICSFLDDRLLSEIKQGSYALAEMIRAEIIAYTIEYWIANHKKRHLMKKITRHL